MSTRQYARLVDEWVTAIGLRPEEYGTHSLRRTQASMIYKATGNLRAIQILLGHSKIENTVRYLGDHVEDALLLVERTESDIEAAIRSIRMAVFGTLDQFLSCLSLVGCRQAARGRVFLKAAIHDADQLRGNRPHYGSLSTSKTPPEADA
jgi:hypothetical protein